MSDYTLDTLLDLNGTEYTMENGWWIKIEAKRIKVANEHKPYGIKYSLTLHDKNGTRLLGFDNAHLVPGARQDEPHDHLHKGERIIRYDYQNAAQLLTDFYDEVDKLRARLDT